MIGIIILVIGIALLLQAMGILTGSIWNFFWALLFIAVGLKMVMSKNHPHCMCGLFGHRHEDCCGPDHQDKK